MVEKISDYSYLIDEFGEEKIKERYELFRCMADTYIKVQNLEKRCFCSCHHLKEAILSYYADISRLKDFHQIEKANYLKIASYSAYWLNKIKPIQLNKNICEEENDSEILPHINAYFSYYVFIVMQYDDEKCIALGISEYEKYSNLSDSLIYSFIYRSINPVTLELIALALRVDSPREEKTS